MEIEPPLQRRFNEKKAIELIQSAGFRVESVKNAGSFHYTIVASKC